VINPFTHRKVLKNGVPGRATIVEMGSLDRGGTSFNLPMTLQVHVDGITPYEVEDQWMVKAKDAVALSGWIPVKVDRGDHHKVAIDWEPLRERYEQEKTARREALANGEPQIISLSGDSDAAQQILSALGFGGTDGNDGDVIGKLERLAALRDSGALTDAEFEEQKRRILS
jgi:hypothetical protein